MLASKFIPVGKIYNSTKINDGSNLIFGFLSESQAQIYSHASGWRSMALKEPFTSDISSTDSDFVAKYQDSERSLLGSELTGKGNAYPFSISDDFTIKLAIMVGP